MKVPEEYGIYLPCAVTHIRDGDTVEISLPGSQRRWAIRFLDCWVPDYDREVSEEAKRFVRRRVCEAKKTSVFIPLTDPIHILRSLVSFDRILGRLFLDDEELGRLLVENDLAGETKDQQLKRFPRKEKR